MELIPQGGGNARGSGEMGRESCIERAETQNVLLNQNKEGFPLWWACAPYSKCMLCIKPLKGNCWMPDFKRSREKVLVRLSFANRNIYEVGEIS